MPQRWIIYVFLYSYSSWYISTTLLSQGCSQVRNYFIIETLIFVSRFQISQLWWFVITGWEARIIVEMICNLAIGSIVGHEITHGFGEAGRHIDKNGKNHTLWSQKTNDMYDKRSKCIIEQYNNYTVSETYQKVCRSVSYFSEKLILFFFDR